MNISFLPGCAEHVPVERPQRGVLLPGVARHLVEHRALAVHDLVVRERQHEVLAEGVEHRERDVVVVPRAGAPGPARVGEHVVHPAHVPLVGEARARRRRRAGSPPGHEVDSSAMVTVPGTRPCVSRVQLLQERRPPRGSRARRTGWASTPRRPRVVQVQHRGHGVDAQAVHVELLEPVQRVAQQEGPHLVAAVVEDRACPSRGARPASGRRARTARCRRSAPARARPSGKWPGTQSSITPGRAGGSVDEVAEVVGRAEAARSARRSR